MVFGQRFAVESIKLRSGHRLLFLSLFSHCGVLLLSNADIWPLQLRPRAFVVMDSSVQRPLYCHRCQILPLNRHCHNPCAGLKANIHQCACLYQNFTLPRSIDHRLIPCSPKFQVPALGYHAIVRRYSRSHLLSNNVRTLSPRLAPHHSHTSLGFVDCRCSQNT